MLDEATAVDVIEALRLLEGRRIAVGGRLSDGALILRRLAFVTAGDMAGHGLGTRRSALDDGFVGAYVYELEEVAARLRLSTRSVKRLIASGALVAVKVGGATRVRPCDLEDYVAGLPAERTAS